MRGFLKIDWTPRSSLTINVIIARSVSIAPVESSSGEFNVAVTVNYVDQSGSADR